MEQNNIRVLTDTAAEAIARNKEGFFVTGGENTLQADKIIVACGGCAGSKLGGVMDGYHLLKSMGHRRTALYPALTQIRTKPDLPKAMKGVKIEGSVTIYRGKECLGSAEGDILFSDVGISGTAVFELSRIASSECEGLEAAVDFFPRQKENDIYQHLKVRAAALSGKNAASLFTGMVQSRVGLVLCKTAKVEPSAPIEGLRDRDLRNLSKAAKNLHLPITGVSGFETAQVTHGGMVTDEFDPMTLESRLVPGLYACGEVLDVDGDCGGYNLQWAWASGLLAGELKTASGR